MLSKEQILKVKDLKTETVDVPEWGGKVKIKTLNGSERDEFEQSIVQGAKVKMSNLTAKLCQLTLVDNSGILLFDSSDIAGLGKKSSKALSRCYEVASRLSGLGKKDMEELEKNSGKGQSEDSTLS